MLCHIDAGSVIWYQR